MIDWSAVLCAGHTSSMAAASTFVPQLLKAFLILVVTCKDGSKPDTTICYPPYSYRAGNLTYTTAPIGVYVSGVNLSEPVTEDVINQLRRDLHVHRMLIFQSQGLMRGERQVEISEWFGELQHNYIGNHPMSPHSAIVRLSNDEKAGMRNVGSQGWHSDGVHQKRPTSIAIYHIVSPASDGRTEFVPLLELAESLSAKRRALWERTWRMDEAGPHPLIFPHPYTALPTMMFHTAGHRTSSFIVDYGTDSETNIEGAGSEAIRRALEAEIEKDNMRLVYAHKWESGDLLMTDNMALAHRASPSTQLPPSKIGVRILHRTSVHGKWIPEKHFENYRLQALENATLQKETKHTDGEL